MLKNAQSLLVGLVVVLLTLNVLSLVWLLDVREDAERARWDAFRVHEVSNQVTSVQRELASLKRASEMLGSTSAQVVASRSNCTTALVGFEAQFNRLPLDAQVTLAYKPTRNLVDDFISIVTRGGDDAPESASELDGAWRQVPATPTGPLSFEAEVPVPDGYEYAYRWAVAGNGSVEGTGTEFVAAGPKGFTGAATTPDTRFDPPRLGYVFLQGDLNTPWCKRMTSVSLVGEANGKQTFSQPLEMIQGQYRGSPPANAEYDRVYAVYKLTDGREVRQRLFPPGNA